MKIKVRVWYPTVPEELKDVEIEVPDELAVLSRQCDIMITSQHRLESTPRKPLFADEPIVWLDVRGGKFRQR